MTRLLRRYMNEANSSIILNAASLMGTTAVTSGLGFVYWWLAARRFPAADVGFASAAISAMVLLGTIAVLGLGTLLIGELARQPEGSASLIATATLVVGGVGGALGALFALVAPLLSVEFRPLATGAGSVLLFALGTSLTAITLVCDQALIGLLRGSLQFRRNALFAVSKLVALGIVAGISARDGGMAIYATWAVGNLLSFAVLSGVPRRRSAWTSAVRPQWSLVRRLGGTALRHHALNVALLVSALLLPLVVTVILSAQAAAYYYTATMLSSLVVIGPTALTTVLYAVGAGNPAALAHRVRFTLGLALLGGVVANVALLVGAEPLLSVFGPDYVTEARWPLHILGFAVFPLIIREHYVTIRRIHGQVAAALPPVLAGSLLALALASSGARVGGLVGLSLGALAGLFLEACFMAPTVYRVTKLPVGVPGTKADEAVARVTQPTTPY